MQDTDLGKKGQVVKGISKREVELFGYLFGGRRGLGQYTDDAQAVGIGDRFDKVDHLLRGFVIRVHFYIS